MEVGQEEAGSKQLHLWDLVLNKQQLQNSFSALSN